MQFTPVGPWGVGASAGPAAKGLKGLSGRVADPNHLRDDQDGSRVNLRARCRFVLLFMFMESLLTVQSAKQKAVKRNASRSALRRQCLSQSLDSSE